MATRIVLASILALAALLGLVTALTAQAPATPLYKDTTANIEARLDDLIPRLTLDEKIDLLSGTGFATRAIPRLGIPAMKMSDGPLGVRDGNSTVLPGGPLMAATWDPVSVANIGKVLGEETLAKGGGETVILGPCVNIHRTPLGGRNGESFSEDPYLAGRTTVAYVKGVQDAGAAATIKHFAVNNQEANRTGVNIHVSERAQREIYFPAFRAGVQEGGAYCIMDSYNSLNGPHASEDDFLLNGVLKNEWGFKGLVMSDWGAVHSALGSVMCGNDLEMPSGQNVTKPAVHALMDQGRIPELVIDDHVRRILRVEMELGVFDGTKKRLTEATISGPEHLALVRQAAEKGIVLLKNEKNALPIDKTKVKSIAVIGTLADRMPTTVGGSGSVSPKVPMTSPLMGLKAAVGTDVAITYTSGAPQGGGAAKLPAIPADVFTQPAGTDAKGLKAEFFNNENLHGTPVATRVDSNVDFVWTNRAPVPELTANSYSVRWSGRITAPTTGNYLLGLTSDDGSRVLIDGKLVLDFWGPHWWGVKTALVPMTAGKTYAIVVEYYQGGGDAGITLGWKAPGGAGATSTGDAGIDAAVAAAAKADVAVVCVGTTGGDEGEEHDRGSLSLPSNQDALVTAVAAANPRTVVVLFSGGVIVPGPWVDQVPALLYAYFPGQEGGAALANILLGTVNPSGRLPDTIGARREDFSDYPYFGTSDVYTEGIYVGYRHFDKEKITPLFPFGHGLSYTTFKYSNLKFTGSAGVSPAPSSPDTMQKDGTLTVSLDVENTGTMAGEEVVQLYVNDPQPKTDKAPQELKGFTRVALKPGEKKAVTLVLDPRSLAYWNEKERGWVADQGVYEVRVGASSRDIRLTGRIKLADKWLEATPAVIGSGTSPKDLKGNLALGKKVTASSQENAEWSPEKAVDGEPGTRWSSAWGEPAWLMVDLGQVTSVARVIVDWEAAYATEFNVQTSVDGKTWTDGAAMRGGQGGSNELKFTPRDAQYVRLNCTRRSMPYGFSLFNMAVFGP